MFFVDGENTVSQTVWTAKTEKPVPPLLRGWWKWEVREGRPSALHCKLTAAGGERHFSVPPTLPA